MRIPHEILPTSPRGCHLLQRSSPLDSDVQRATSVFLSIAVHLLDKDALYPLEPWSRGVEMSEEAEKLELMEVSRDIGMYALKIFCCGKAISVTAGNIQY